MLNLLRLHNFKSFLNAEVRFSERHLLIGRNGSGKTNVIKALQFLSRAGCGDLDSASAILPGGITEVCNWHLKSDEFTLSCVCGLDFEGSPYEYEYKLRLRLQTPTGQFPPSELTLRVAEERLTIQGEGFDGVVLLESDGQRAVLFKEEKFLAGKRILHEKTTAPEGATLLSKMYPLPTNQRAMRFRRYLQNWQYYSISPLAIRLGGSGLGGSAAAPWGALDTFGEHLANAIFHVKNVDELRYRRIIEHVRIIEPALEAILFLVPPGQSPVPFVQMEGDVEYPGTVSPMERCAYWL